MRISSVDRGVVVPQGTRRGDSQLSL